MRIYITTILITLLIHEQNQLLIVETKIAIDDHSREYDINPLLGEE